MGVVYTALFLYLMLTSHGAISLSEFHGMLTEEEVLSYARKAHVEEYDIILPKLHSRLSKRNADPSYEREAHKVTFTAFDEYHHVVLQKNGGLLRPGLEVEYIQQDGSIRKEPVTTRDCHFFATSVSHAGSTGAISTCGGLRGALTVNGEMFYIEPLKEDHKRRIRRSSEDAVQPHIIYKRSVPMDDAVCPVGKGILGNNAGSTESGTLANETLYDGPYLGRKTLELFYVVDKLVFDEYQEETESYALAVLNIMSRRFADPTLDIDLRFTVNRFLVSTTETITADNPNGVSVGFTPLVGGLNSLEAFCPWQASLKLNNDSDPQEWDLAILFTGHDIETDNGNSNLLGIAYVGAACDPANACGVTENNGLHAGLVMAHETGHNLGLQHDEVYGCTPHFNIMSERSTRGIGTFEWSSCSREHMKIFISGEQCMNDVSSPQNITDIIDLPGQRYNGTEQCLQSAGTAFHSLTCTDLWCVSPNDPGSFIGVGPPAEGTPCGEGLWCLNARCVNSSLSYSTPVDGGWSGYGVFSACSRTCGTGVQYRSRTCTEPTPQWGGMPCVGESRIYMLCNEEPCETSQHEFRVEQCAATNSVSFNGVLYSWTDLYSQFRGDGLCQFNCLAVGNNFYTSRGNAFCDGTYCWDSTNEPTELKSTRLCLDGMCQNFGCDGVLNSGLLYDDCRVCGGDGSSCNCTSDLITTASLIGETVYFTIPAGSTSISVRNTGSSHYVGLVVNGRVVISAESSPPGRFTEGNMDFEYIVSGGSVITPLSEPSTLPLDITVWTAIGSINVEYRYCTPSDVISNVSVSTSGTFVMSSTTVPIIQSSSKLIATASSSTLDSSVSSVTSLPTIQTGTSIPTILMSSPTSPIILSSSQVIATASSSTSDSSVSSVTSLPTTHTGTSSPTSPMPSTTSPIIQSSSQVIATTSSSTSDSSVSSVTSLPTTQTGTNQTTDQTMTSTPAIGILSSTPLSTLSTSPSNASLNLQSSSQSMTSTLGTEPSSTTPMSTTSSVAHPTAQSSSQSMTYSLATDPSFSTTLSSFVAASESSGQTMDSSSLIGSSSATPMSTTTNTAQSSSQSLTFTPVIGISSTTLIYTASLGPSPISEYLSQSMTSTPALDQSSMARSDVITTSSTSTSAFKSSAQPMTFTPAIEPSSTILTDTSSSAASPPSESVSQSIISAMDPSGMTSIGTSSLGASSTLESSRHSITSTPVIDQSSTTPSDMITTSSATRLTSESFIQSMTSVIRPSSTIPLNTSSSRASPTSDSSSQIMTSTSEIDQSIMTPMTTSSLGASPILESSSHFVTSLLTIDPASPTPMSVVSSMNSLPTTYGTSQSVSSTPVSDIPGMSEATTLSLSPQSSTPIEQSISSSLVAFDMTTTAVSMTPVLDSSSDIISTPVDGISPTPTPNPTSSDVMTSSIAPTQVFDPCNTAPCLNEGNCSSAGGTYTCTCPNTHTGTNCETVFDPCNTAPCMNGGTCNSASGTYTCTCPNTHSGTNCENEVDNCLSSPCGVGTCSSSNGVYICTCPETHEGTNCETARTECSFTGCPIREVCNANDVCVCTGNRVRNNAGICRSPISYRLRIVIIRFRPGANNAITDFTNIVNNPSSPEATEVMNVLTIHIFTLYRARYGPRVIGVVIISFNLGSLDVDADVMFAEPDSPTEPQLPTPEEAAEVIMDSLMNDTTGQFEIIPSMTTVTDINECLNSTLNDCSPHATCTNNVGSYTCACPDSGFTDATPVSQPERGLVCEDIDECNSTNTCDEFASCTNTVGSFICTCFEGFLGNGQECTRNPTGLNDGAVAGIITGAVVVLFFLFFLIVGLILWLHRIKQYNHAYANQIHRVAPYGREAKEYSYDNGGYQRDVHPMVNYPSKLDPRNNPGYSNGGYYSEPIYNYGFTRPYVATGRNGSKASNGKSKSDLANGVYY